MMATNEPEFNSSDPEHVKRRNQRIRVQQSADEAMLLAIMQQRAGREWVYGLLGYCQVYGATFRTNALETAFGEGRRDVGLRLMADLNSTNALRALYIQMLQERLADDAAR